MTTARGAEGLERATKPGELLPAPSASAASCRPPCGQSCTPVQLAHASGLDKPIPPVGPNVYFSGAITYEASHSYFGRASKSGGSSAPLAQSLQRPPGFLSSGTSAYAVVRYPGNSGLGHLNELTPDGRIIPVPGIDGSLSLTAVDSMNLYSVDIGGRSVWSTPLIGGGT